MSHPNTNKWTPAIYSKTSPVDWTAERNRSENFQHFLAVLETLPSDIRMRRAIRVKQKSKQIKRNSNVLFKGK